MIGGDHAGFALKQEIATLARDEGHDVLDVGARSAEPSDYPDFAEAVGLAVLERRAARHPDLRPRGRRFGGGEQEHAALTALEAAP